MAKSVYLFSFSSIKFKTKKPENHISSLPIGKTGFEPATPWSQTRCSTKLSYFPKSAPRRSRTFNLLIRSQTLYPIALWVHVSAEDRDRTGTVITNRRILSPVRLPIPPPRHYRTGKAEDGIRTRDPHHGKVMFYH